ncbi:MAG: acetylglutamate kinase, partial [Alphaproteobacteria bacterium]
AAELAVALGASKLILLTDVEGVKGPDGQVISELGRARAEAMIAGGQAEGGMIPKLEAAVRSLDAVPYAHIIDGRTPHALLLELFTEAGIGTMVTP